MNFGIFGCHHAHIGLFIEEMIQLDHRFIGIYEKENRISKAMSEKYGAPLFSDLDSFLACRPEIVGTAAINNEKINVIEICEQHRIHVMADKPIVTNQKDYEKLADIAARQHIVIGLMLTERFNPPIYTLKKMIDQNCLGDLVSFTFIKPHKLNKQSREPWHFSKKLNGGIVVDLLIHDIDLLRWMTGSDIQTFAGYVYKQAHPEFKDFCDSVKVIANTENGISATMEADWWEPDSSWTWGDGKIICTGKKGRVEIRVNGDVNIKKEPFGIFASQDENYHIYDNLQPPITLAEDFVNRIQQKDHIISTEAILRATCDALAADQAVTLIKKENDK